MTDSDRDARHARLLKLDQQHVWHPFTQMQGWIDPAPGDEPLIIDHAMGSWLFDTQGRKYLDGVASLWVNVHGHRKMEIDSAIKLQLSNAAHTTLLGLGSPPSIELAAELIQRAPRFPGQPVLNRVFYSDSGSTAVEVALKIAFQHFRQSGKPKKKKFVALGEAYHGDTLGSVALGGVDMFHEIFLTVVIRRGLEDTNAICLSLAHRTEALPGGGVAGGRGADRRTAPGDRGAGDRAVDARRGGDDLRTHRDISRASPRPAASMTCS